VNKPGGPASGGEVQNPEGTRAGRPLVAVGLRALMFGLTPFAVRLARTRPPAPFPGYAFGKAEKITGRYLLRLMVWKLCRRLSPGEVSVVVPWFEGTEVAQYLGNDTSRCLFVAGCFEPNEIYYMQDALRPGMTVLDCGANEGLFSVMAGRRVGPTGRVVALEPSMREFERLSANVRRNNLESVVVCCREAVTEHDGVATLHVVDGEHAGQNTFGAPVYDGVAVVGDEEVPTTTIDSLVERCGVASVDFVKMDVEGAEFQALSGARKMLARDRPTILVEVNDDALRAQGSSSIALVDLLRKVGYDVMEFGDDGILIPVVGAVESLNVVALPRASKVESRSAVLGNAPTVGAP